MPADRVHSGGTRHLGMMLLAVGVAALAVFAPDSFPQTAASLGGWFCP